ncbi:hypothetical protein HC928_13955, partial [bacterium]|nr:hypothetical protein [bacterium]
MRLLFVALARSIHTARWLSQLKDTGWDLHLFPAEDQRRVHPALRGVTVHHSVYAPQPEAGTLAAQGVRFEGLREMSLQVTKAPGRDPKIPVFAGGKLPISTMLAHRVMAMLNAPETWGALP